MNKAFLISYFFSAIALFSQPVSAQTASVDWRGDDWQGTIDNQGHVTSIVFKDQWGNDTIPFVKDLENAGPSFYINLGGSDTACTWQQTGNLRYKTRIDDICCELEYTRQGKWPAWKITLSNEGHVPFQPVKAGLKMGIDTYMSHFPQWNSKYFPTLLYNSTTHFYGYLQSPSGHCLALFCPQPIASWSLEYNLGYQDPAPHWFMGHRIKSMNLDFLNALPLPAHCPQNCYSLNPGEQRSWTISLTPVAPDSLEQELYEASGLPIIDMPRTNYDTGDSISFRVFAHHPRVVITDANGKTVENKLSQKADGEWLVNSQLSGPGFYTVNTSDGEWHSQGLLTVHQPWSWCLRRAREAAWKYKQKATSHAESWYGFYSAFIAARIFPETNLDARLDQRFEQLFTMLHDTVSMVPKYYKSRIQNTSTTIGLLVKRYEAYHRIADLDRASRLADWLINFSQAKNGAYMNGRTVYTAVIYVAKSIMELYEAESQLSASSPLWKKRAHRHYLSAKRAVDQLVKANGDFETEGEMTYEDGMISCAALQIGAFALLQDNDKALAHYAEAMLSLLRGHECITQLHVPDARRRGGTLRFWEAQYDVMMLPNMINSPHGWSAWRCYATYYAYLLTGDVRWLKQTYNAMGAFANLIDAKTGTLRWAFVDDPYLKVRQTCAPDTHYTADSLSFGNPHPDLYPTRSFTIGEQYVGMISDWQGVNTQDNDVHEVFKCMGEAVLTNAFLVENPNGSLTGYNCKVSRKGSHITVTPDEDQVTKLHCNLQNGYDVTFGNTTKTLPKHYLGWMQ